MSLRMERIGVGKLRPAKYNPRKNLKPGDLEYEKLKRSIERFDLVEPIVWNERSGNIVGGHQRFKILKARGDKEIDVSVVDLDENEEAALNVALNKISGEWNFPVLADLLSELDANGFDATLTGFDTGELERLLGIETEKDQPVGSSADEFLCVVDCKNESTLSALYDELQQRGFECKLIT